MSIFKGIKEGIEEFGKSISLIINTLLLTIVYFLGIGLTSVFARIFNKKFMDLKIDKNTRTYWEDLNLTKKEKGEYFKQF